MTTERRKHKRLNEANRVIIRLIAEGGDSVEHNEIFAITKDISKKGARLLTDVMFPVGTVFKTIVVLSKSKETLQFDCIVKWVRRMWIDVEYSTTGPLTPSFLRIFNKIFDYFKFD